jgi:hypothetical protein
MMDWPCGPESKVDYEDEEDEGEETGSTGRTRKKPWRYRWPDDFRDEVLARLLDLNQKRAEFERLMGVTVEGSRRRRSAATGKTRSARARPDQANLPGL